MMYDNFGDYIARNQDVGSVSSQAMTIATTLQEQKTGPNKDHSAMFYLQA